MPDIMQVFNMENMGKTLETNEWEPVRGAVWAVRILVWFFHILQFSFY